MSQKINYRRGESRHQDNGPTWEGSGTPNAGCNSGHVARGRCAWKRINNRKERRTGSFVSYAPMAKPRTRPDYDEE